LGIATELASLIALGFAVAACSSCRDSSATTNELPSSSSASAQAGEEVKEVSLPGVDTSPMTPRERREWSGLVGQLLSPCPNVPVPVAQCLQEQRPCAACLQAAKWIAHAVRAGAPEETLRHAYRERFDPSAVKSLPLAGSPSRGPESAPVTVVEFADFECPHCRMFLPAVDAMFAAHEGKVHLVYKFVSLSGHTHAEPAARAAWAAGQQGKFWEMEHMLFERQEHLEGSDLERYAQMLKLDVARWKGDMESQAAKDRIAEDRKLEDDLKLKGTPTIYVNGRELELEADESLEDRVAGELGVPPAPPPSSATANAPPPAPSP
jgi:protein-disulfide isomerase